MKKLNIVILLLVFPFLINSCRHNKDDRIIDSFQQTFLLSKSINKELDSCSIKRIILYVENQTCISCVEETLYPLFSLLVDSFPNIHPLLIIHDENGNTTNYKWNEQYKRVFRIVDSNKDSIRLLNSWIPQNHVYYGFLLDSINKVKECGFLYNNIFIQDCKDVINEDLIR